MFAALHKTAEKSLVLPIGVDEAFPLFTPEGERHWIEDWNPRYLYPANGETIAGMVFTTGEGAETTYWTVIDYDHPNHAARYSRVTPGVRSVLVDVTCRAISMAETEVTVRYALTGLSETGNAMIEDFILGYDAMIEQWRLMILAYLGRSHVHLQP